ncbi:MAG: hypothetical protein ACPLVJ_03350 [Candidatus Bathyarchaeales archaeon]
MLCFSVTGHEADFVLVFGRDERVLRVCRFCFEDLMLLGFRADKVVRLEVSGSLKVNLPLRHLVVLGPVYTLLMEAEV